MAVIKLISVCKSLSNLTILDGVNLEVRAGEIAVIRGRSGVGKTTLAKIAALLIKPEKGVVEFMGQNTIDVDDAKRSYLRLKFIGYVDQMFRLIPYISVYDNIELPLKLLGIPKAERRKRITEVTSALGIEGKLNSYPDELSGGERQRVAIARAIVKNPSLVVCDEPTSNLDDYTAQSILKIFRILAKERGIAFLITTTDLYQDFSQDKDYMLIQGKLCERCNAKVI